ncbi:MAG: zinc metalloprotease [Flavobacterium sp.]|nr:zinc metalloprotease [Flavobacterium sp.]
MKKITIILVAIALVYSCKPTQKILFDCGTAENYSKRLEADPAFRNAENELEKKISTYMANLRKNPNSFQSTTITIPVVVHVVYKNATENVSLAQINSQITALNESYRRTNADLSSSPSVFTTLAADANIEFALAQRDPNCNPTDGIIRRETTQINFDNDDMSSSPTVRNPVKFTSSGGDDAWPSDRYLNIWVCDLAGGLVGYASFPSDLATRPTEDGVVMDFRGFGTTGTATAPLNLGRVCGHEVGHWLNLRHIWGDDSACVQSDFVADTPNQGPNNSGYPAFPHVSCSNGPNGDMFCDQMDYTDDACRTMFTIGQSDRMAATLYTVRSSIASSSGAIPPPPPGTSDVFSKDTGNDVGNEPNNESTILYASDDIWIRNTNDGFTNQEHQRPNGGQVNYVYVRVRNKGCNTSASANVKLYWASASTGLSWPTPWDGSITAPAVMGGTLGTQPTGAITGNGFKILEFTWTAPDPSDYASLGGDMHHFCLLSRIETSNTFPFGMTAPETSALGDNVKNNNKIVWKNVSVIDTDGPGMFTNVLVANYSKMSERYNIVIKPLEKQKNDGITIYINQKSTLLALAKRQNVRMVGIKNQEGHFLVEGKTAQINGVELKPGGIFSLGFDISLNKRKQGFKREVHEFLVEQYTENGVLVGGQVMKIKVSNGD